MARLKQTYKDDIVPALMEEFGYKNIMQVPKLSKVVINIGLGEAVTNVKLIDNSLQELMQISGQRPVVTKAKKSIATYKLRKGMPIGVMVTLRGKRMYEFLDRLINVSIPNVRDFRGVSRKAFDGRGNFSMGIKEQIVFPEINYDKVQKIQGMNITINTTANSDEEARSLIKKCGMPFTTS
jgi:large subunit ribosomal protein L5